MSNNDLNVDVRLPRPRIRTGAIIWGLIVTTIGAGALALLLNPALRQATIDALLSLTGFGIVIAVFALIGLFILVTSLVVLIRRAQTRSELRHADALAGDGPTTD
jgi:hypothetical protein